MKIGDRVRLIIDVGPCCVGDEGLVRQVDALGNMTLRITHRADGTEFTYLLMDVSEEEVVPSGRHEPLPRRRPARRTRGSWGGSRQRGRRGGRPRADTGRYPVR